MDEDLKIVINICLFDCVEQYFYKKSMTHK